MQSKMTMIVLNYNHGEFIENALASLEIQTRRPDRVFVIDDCSTDNSVERILPFFSRQTNWRLIRREKNVGALAGLNDGLEWAFEENPDGLIGFLAADDWLYPDYIEAAVAALSRCSRAGFFCAVAALETDQKVVGLRPPVFPRKDAGFVSADKFRKLLERGDNYFLGPVSVYRTKHLKDLGGYDPDLGSLCDGVLARRMAARYGFYFSPDVMGHWQITGENYSLRTALVDKNLTPALQRAKEMINKDGELFPPDYACQMELRTRFAAARIILRSTKLAPMDKAEPICSLFQRLPGTARTVKRLLGIPVLGSWAALIFLTLRVHPFSYLSLLEYTIHRKHILQKLTPVPRPRNG